MNRTFFSIITPTYNRAYIINKTIESVLRQNFDDWEMIIIDDGSTDNTKDIVQKYLQQSSKIKYLRLERNSGPNIARNFGVEKAKGDWLIFLDSDDELIDNALEVIHSYIQKLPDVSFFIFACKDLDGNMPINIKNYEGYLSYKDFIRKIKGEALPVIKKEVFLEEKFMENIKGGEAITWIKILKRGYRAYFSNKVLRIYNDKLEDRLSVKSKNYKRLATVHYLFFKNFYKDLFKNCPFKLISTIIKIITYETLSFFQK
ncbi:MAG: glycosyl transferase family 2 [Candidatus Parcubacteria bacterium]|nr:MAG: glycosyl transferase family 2 [Candidatus Parcubacteria bacterium]